MKTLLSLLTLIALCGNAFCQSPLLERLEVTGQFAFQVHDQRFFSGHLEESGWGTTQYRFGVHVRILKFGKLNLHGPRTG